MDDQEPQERRLFLQDAETYIELEDVGTALNLAQTRLRQIPGDLDARIVICRVWLLQGRLDEARDMLQEMEEILASLSQIYACMGDICMKKGMQGSADDFYRKFKMLNPGTTPVRDISERLKDIEGLQSRDEAAEAMEAAEEAEAAEAAEQAEEAEVPADFQTVTLAELYIRQGHLGPAEEVLAKIVGLDPQNEKAARLLAEVRERIVREAAVQRYAAIIAELSRWLDNIGRLRGHAA